MALEEHFAVWKIEYHAYLAGVFIKVWTDHPCYLTCYYTEKKPLKHHTERIVRGLAVPWGVYFCFVAWQTTPQIEAGDVYGHTFWFPAWEYKQTKWFTFRGTVTGSESPSVAPIFEYTNVSLVPRIQWLYPLAAGIACHIHLQTANPCPLHFLNVQEHIPDEDTTMNYETGFFGNRWFFDWYHIDSLLTNGSIIVHARLWGRFKREHGFAFASIAKLSLILLPDRQDSGGFNAFGATWEYRNMLRPANPWTGNPWTEAEILQLQIGVGLRAYSGVGWEAHGYCTQTFLEVELTHPW